MLLSIYLFLIAHFLGDYYLQGNQLVEEKKTKLSALFLHILIQFALMLLAAWVMQSAELLWAGMAITVSHFVLDFLKIRISRHKKNQDKGRDFQLYFSDQVLHILIIIVAVYFAAQVGRPQLFSPLAQVLQNFQIDPLRVAKVLLILTIIIQPTNITMKLFLQQFDFTFEDLDKVLGEEDDNLGLRSAKREAKGLENAGSIIGILERIIMFILVIHQQYGAIGFILTAKSITRYEKITKSSQFAEYYLIGTLLSTVNVLGVTFLIY